MKTTKTPARKRTNSPNKTRKAAIKNARPFHRRVLLHPFSIMVVLCAGVILAGSTYQGLAVSYDVTATVQAPPPSGPAVITTPQHLEHFNNQQIVVAGTCPAATYVKLYRDEVFSGVANCTATTFHIQTSLIPGDNQLQAKVYNITNLEGPASPAVIVYYDDTTAAPPAAPPVSLPTTMWVTSVGSSSYQPGSVLQSGSRPTVSGYALPYADIVVTFHSEVATCKTRADAAGWWTCTLDHALPEGIHHVDVVASNDQGWSFTLPTFEINVRSSLPNVLKPRRASLIISSEYHHQTHYVGQPFTWSLGTHGGTTPYMINVDWGDDSQSVFSRTDGTTFTLTHAYPEARTYAVFIRATDSKGVAATLQLNAVVKGQAIGAASLTNSGPLASMFSSIGRYLWIVWPVYIAVVLMVVSYWLGEQDVYRRMFRRRQVPAGRKR